jgi:DNA-binding GntR family transcriptional regulator
MSRTPVHEAVIRLQEEGLVRVLTRRGVLICTVSPDDMREIYAVIIALETMAAELLAGQPEVDRAAWLRYRIAAPLCW